MTAPFLRHLADVCRAHPTRAKWAVVSSHAVGYTLGERLALEGTDWLNLRLTTAYDLALQAAAPWLVEQGLDPAPEDLGPALVMRLLLDLPAAVPTYFRTLGEQPAMAEALWSALRELRLAGIGSADLPANAFDSTAKHAELQALLAAYERYLTDHKLADTATLLREATMHVADAPVLARDLLVLDPDLVRAPVERAFLEALPGERSTVPARELPALVRPRRLAAPATLVPPAAPACDAHRLLFLLAPAAAPPPFADGTIDRFRAGGREAEIEEVFRRIQSLKTPLDQVEIACAGAEDARLAWEKAARHEWPATIGTGIPACLSRPGRALLGWCDWVERDFPASDLRRLLHSGDVRLDLGDGCSSGQAARLLARAKATWGRATYGLALQGLATQSRTEAGDPDTDADRRAYLEARADRAERLRGVLDGLVSAVPSSAPGSVTVVFIVDAALAFLETSTASTGELDGAARQAIAALLRRIRLLVDVARTLPEALGFIRDAVARATVGADHARPGHLHLSLLREAGDAGRPHVFVIGLDEGHVMPAAVEDPVLLDEERRAIHPALPTSEDRIAEARFTLVSRIAGLGDAARRACFSHSCRDLRDARETLPSWVLLQVERLRSGDVQLDFAGLDKALGDPVSPVPRAPCEATSDAGWWLATLREAREAGRETVLMAFPALAAGEQAARARVSEAFTPFDGHVADAAALDPRAHDRAVSATALEQLAKCPYGYFLKYGLRLETLEREDARQDDRWLDVLTRGSELHALYALVMREVRRRGTPVNAKKDRAWVLAEAGKQLSLLRERMPPPSEVVHAREVSAYLRDVELFLDQEARERDRVPVALEVSFGEGDEAGDGEPLARPDPVEIDLGNGRRFFLRGRIDRIDRIGEHEYEVVDYKTGSFWADAWTGTFHGGSLLQHALYSVAAAEMLRRIDTRAKVVRGTYYFSSVKGTGERVSIGTPPKAKLHAVLNDLFDIVSNGAFVRRTRKECEWCDFGRACPAEVLATVSAKHANQANAALAPVLRLETHA